ncbi:MAG: hypothetical protein R2838_05935 [Caldilineaceae bacterium]
MQWLDDPPAGAAGLTAVDGQTVDVPARLPQLAATWTAAGAPLLPAGQPAAPCRGVWTLRPLHRSRHVRVDARGPEARALAARRGWLTNSPGLWLALRTDDSGRVHVGWWRHDPRCQRRHVGHSVRRRYGRAGRVGPVAGWAGPSANWTCRRWTGVGR